MHKIANHSSHRRWKEYEDLARERPKPLAASSFHSPEPGLGAQLCEWIARHWLLYLLLVGVALAGGCLLLDSIRGAR